MFTAEQNTVRHLSLVATIFIGCVLFGSSAVVTAKNPNPDQNEVKVEVRATNADGYTLKAEAEGTGLGFINVLRDPPEHFFGDLRGEVKLTDPFGNECEAEIVASDNGIVIAVPGAIARLGLYGASGLLVVSIVHNDSVDVVMPPGGLSAFIGCVVPAIGPIIFPGDGTEVEIEKD